MTRIALERLTDNSIAARNFQKIEAQWIKGPAQARVYKTTTTTLTTGATTVISFDTERWDTGAFHSTSTNTSRLTAPTDGLYLIGAHMSFAANATGLRAVTILQNNTDTIGYQSQGNAGAVLGTVVTVTTLHQLAAGDYVEVTARQDSGGNLGVAGSNSTTAQYGQDFWIVRIGSQG